jgi:hypothetical protein
METPQPATPLTPSPAPLTLHDGLFMVGRYLGAQEAAEVKWAGDPFWSASVTVFADGRAHRIDYSGDAEGSCLPAELRTAKFGDTVHLAVRHSAKADRSILRGV